MRKLSATILAILMPLAALPAADAELDKLNEEVEALLEAWKLPEAQKAAEEAVAATEAEYGASAEELLAPLSRLSDVYHRRCLFLEDLATSRRMLAIAEAPKNSNAKWTAKALDRVATAQRSLGNPVAAESLFRKALQLRQKASPTKERNVAIAQYSLASVLTDLGEYTEAEELLSKALATIGTLGSDTREKASALIELGSLRKAQGRYAEAAMHFAKAAAIRKAVYPEDAPNVAGAIGFLAKARASKDAWKEAEGLYRQALAMDDKALGPEHAYAMGTLASLAQSCRSQHKTDETESLLSEIARRARQVLADRSRGIDVHALSIALRELANGEKRDLVEELAQLGLERVEQDYGKDSILSLELWQALTRVYSRRDRHEEAVEVFARALRICQSVQPENHVRRSELQNCLCSAMLAAGQHEAVEALCQKSLPKLAVVPGTHSPAYIRALGWLARAVTNSGRREEGDKLLREALALCAPLRDGETAVRWSVENVLISSLASQNKIAEAEQVVREAWQARQQNLGPEHRLTLQMAATLGDYCRIQGRLDEALRLQRPALEVCQRRYANDDLTMVRVLVPFGMTLTNAGESEEACALLAEALERLEHMNGYSRDYKLMCANHFATAKTALGEYTEAVETLDHALAAHEEHLPPDNYQVALAKLGLACGHGFLKSYDRAISFCEQAAPVLLQHADTDSRSAGLAERLLANLYHKVGRHAEARELEKRIGPSDYTIGRRERIRRWAWLAGGILGGVLLLLALMTLYRRRRRRADTTPPISPSSAVLASLAGRRTWPITELKVCALRPNLTLAHTAADGSRQTLLLWEQCDRLVPVLQIRGQETVYELSTDEYGQLARETESRETDRRPAQPCRASS